MKYHICLLVLPVWMCMYSPDTQAQNIDTLFTIDSISTIQDFDSTFSIDSIRIDNQKVKPKRRIYAALLCLTLGPFGMHRLYLGTEPRVAAAYTLTLGGGCGLITVIDLFAIVFSKDISHFKDNDQFIMWKKE